MSASRRCEPSTAAIGVETSRDHWTASLLQNHMEHIDCDAFRPESEGEGLRVLVPALDALLVLEDDIASRLTCCFAWRLEWLPDDIISEVSELVRSTRSELQVDLAPSGIGTLRPSMPIVSGQFNTLYEDHMLLGRSNKLIETDDLLSFESIHTTGHRRGFSFLPGDDSISPAVSRVSGS